MRRIKDLIKRYNKEVTIYDKSTKYNTVLFTGTAFDALYKYGDCIYVNYEKYDDGIDIFIYSTIKKNGLN